MALETYKFLVKPVLLERNEGGAVSGEAELEPFVCYGVQGLQNFADGWEQALQQMKEADGVVPD